MVDIDDLARGMVQTKEQYSFIYRVAQDALNDLLKWYEPLQILNSCILQLIFEFIFFKAIFFSLTFLPLSPQRPPLHHRQSWQSEGKAAEEFLKAYSLSTCLTFDLLITFM